MKLCPVMLLSGEAKVLVEKIRKSRALRYKGVSFSIPSSDPHVTLLKAVEVNHGLISAVKGAEKFFSKADDLKPELRVVKGFMMVGLADVPEELIKLRRSFEEYRYDWQERIPFHITLFKEVSDPELLFDLLGRLQLDFSALTRKENYQFGYLKTWKV